MRGEMENEEICGNTKKKHTKKYKKHKVEDRKVGRKFPVETCREEAQEE